MLRAGKSLLLVALAFSILEADEPKSAEVQVGSAKVTYYYAGAGGASQPQPLAVFVSGAGQGNSNSVKALFAKLQPSVAAKGWNLAVPGGDLAAVGWGDPVTKALEAIVEDCRKRLVVDPDRVYLLGNAEGTNQVFYTVSRIPDLWAAALAVEGSPKPAIDSNRLYGGNTQLVPVLWLVRKADQESLAPLYQKLKAATFNVERQTADSFSIDQGLDWLASKRLYPPQAKVDCETGNATLARCYWVRMTRFNPALRNDALRSTRVNPGSGAALSIGPFGFDSHQPGPGVVVGWLPPNYQGPLRLQDRIMSIAGKPVQDAEDYLRMMDEFREEKNATVMVHRGKEKVRLDNRIVIPKKEEPVTVRVTGEYSPELKEILLISRGVTELRFTVPEAWAPCKVTWNGQDVMQASTPGCWVANQEGAMRVAPCGQ